MNNLIEELKRFVRENKTDKTKYELTLTNKGITIDYKQAEFLFDYIEAYENDYKEIKKYNELLQDYTRILRKENEELKLNNNIDDSNEW